MLVPAPVLVHVCVSVPGHVPMPLLVPAPLHMPVSVPGYVPVSLLVPVLVHVYASVLGHMPFLVLVPVRCDCASKPALATLLKGITLLSHLFLFLRTVQTDK